jgi:hypothetical protein
MPHLTENEIFRACRTVFGAELQLNHEFLNYLQPSGVRSAYRQQAKDIHPDRFAVSSSAVRARQQRLFQDLNQAHQTLLKYLQQRHFIRIGTAKGRASRTAGPQQQQRQDPPRKPQWSRPLPPRPLQFGQYLYYLGVIPFNALIEAITWQRRQRPLLGQIALRWGWLSETDVKRILQERGAYSSFGERAEKLGLLSSVQVRTLLYHQRTHHTRIGDYFVERGLFSENDLNHLLAQLAEHNRRHRQGFSSSYYYYHR